MSEISRGSTVIVTGCAGFIGSNLVDHLLQSGLRVVGLDDLSTGKPEFLSAALLDPHFTFYQLDLLESAKLPEIFQGASFVFHLSANADVRFGPENPLRDFQQNTEVTHRVLEAMRITGIQNIVFSSTGSVYGEARETPTPENTAFPIQTSLYGASKLASEGLIQAYSEAFGMRAWIFRFVSILGPRYTHGHVIDFYKQLLLHPMSLSVLGNGRQRKSYLHVFDCIRAIMICIDNDKEKLNIYNLGVNDTCEVRDSIKWICAKLDLDPVVIYGKENQGWIGDNPLIHLNTSKIEALGWHPSYTIRQAIESTIDFLILNKWLTNGH